MKFIYLILLILVVNFSLFSCKNTKQEDQYDRNSLNIETNEEINYAEIGMNIALSTKGQLGKNLIGTIQKEGTVNALKFCNIKAYPLTDSMSVAFNAKIKRVSDRPRNIDNAANEIELAHINTFKNKLENGEKIDPIINKKVNSVHFYAPIITDQLCLQCHGNNSTDIKLNVLKAIDSLYPNDMAKGYALNQVRGIWSIEIDTK